MTAPRRHPGGRPKWIPPDLKQVESLASKGLTFEQIADALGIHVATLFRKKREFSEFSEALKKARATGIALVANKLFEAAMGGDVTAMIFFLKAQAGWRDRHEVEVNVSGNVEVNIQEERRKQLARLRQLSPEQLALLKEHQRAMTEIMNQANTKEIETMSQPADEQT
jgi:Helix-turn-helix of insertion element transposase